MWTHVCTAYKFVQASFSAVNIIPRISDFENMAVTPLKSSKWLGSVYQLSFLCGFGGSVFFHFFDPVQYFFWKQLFWISGIFQIIDFSNFMGSCSQRFLLSRPLGLQVLHSWWLRRFHHSSPPSSTPTTTTRLPTTPPTPIQGTTVGTSTGP